MTFPSQTPDQYRARREQERADHMRALCKPTEGRGSYGGTTGDAVPKENASQSESYMAAVRLIGFCMLCKIDCRPDFCHRNMTKGMGIKTDVREGWPGCRPCHVYVDSSGKLPREKRRELELRLGAQTRKEVQARGMWPKGFPMWSEL